MHIYKKKSFTFLYYKDTYEFYNFLNKINAIKTMNSLLLKDPWPPFIGLLH